MSQGNATRSETSVNGTTGTSSVASPLAGNLPGRPPTSVRWVVLFTGRKATEDYQPASSDGEKPALVREVTNICVALHPHSDIRLFPQSGEALLYYRARSTGDTVLTRVSTAPNPDGVRTALEYASLILPEADFKSLLGGDPFAALRATDLFERVRTQFLSGARTPITAEGIARAAGASNGAVGTPSLGEDPLATPENVAALEAYCAAAAASSKKIPAFATWWSSGGAIPPSVFEIVLRAAPARALSLREATDLLGQFSADVKSALPRTSDPVSSDLARSILASADAAQQIVTNAGMRINTETPAQFQAQLTEASGQAAKTVADIAALTGRLGDSLPAAEAARLAALSARAEDMVRELPRVRHPNPFARRTPAPDTAAAETAAAAAAADTRLDAAALAEQLPSGRNARIGIGALLVAIVGFGIWGAMGHGGGKTAPGPTASANPANSPRGIVKPASPAASARKPVNAATTALVAAQEVVEPVAKASAQKAASAAITAANPSISDDALDALVATAISAAYKTALSPAQYHAAYGAGKPWTFARYKTAVPNLASSVHEAAAVGAAEGQAALKLAAAKASPSPKPTEAATPEPKKRHNDETPSPEPKPKKRPSSAPPHRSEGSASTPPPVKAGSAAQTGL